MTKYYFINSSKSGFRVYACFSVSALSRLFNLNLCCKAQLSTLVMKWLLSIFKYLKCTQLIFNSQFYKILYSGLNNLLLLRSVQFFRGLHCTVKFVTARYTTKYRPQFSTAFPWSVQYLNVQIIYIRHNYRQYDYISN